MPRLPATRLHVEAHRCTSYPAEPALRSIVLKTEPDVWPEEHVRFGTCVMTKPPRYTTETDAPDPPAPAIVCPTCDQRLVYLKTLIGGIRPTERWDFYQCETCHTMFEYRHRTRRLRIAESA